MEVKMSKLEQHEMVLEAIHPSGAEEWYCPTCGRRFTMQWPPEYNKVILDPGDENAIHSGGRATAQPSSTYEQSDSPLIVNDDIYLNVFSEWMDQTNFD